MKRILVAVGIVAAVSVAAGLYFRGETMSPPGKDSSIGSDATGSTSTSFPAPGRAEIEKRAHVQVPESARELKVHAVDGGIDQAIFLRFELPAGDFPQFIEHTGISGPLSTTRRFVHDYTATNIPWWTPDAIDPYQSANLIRDQSKPRYALSLLTSAGEQPLYTVYLFVTGL